MKKIKNYNFYLKLLLLMIMSIVYLYFSFRTLHWAQHFSELADRIINGQLDLIVIPKLNPVDFVTVNGKNYWPLSPFPSILLVVFKLIFGRFFTQVHLLIIFDLLLIYFVYVFTKRIIKNFDDVVYFISAFLFGSIYAALIYDSSAYYIAHIISSVLTFAFLYEFINKKRFLVMGILLSFIMATRLTAVFIVVLVIIQLYKTGLNQQSFKKFFLFSMPVIIMIILLCLYNYVRFRNFTESGYGISYILPLMETYRQKGLFNLTHVPMNFYWYFLSTPVIYLNSDGNLTFPFIVFNRWGLSLFIVAPFFFYSLKTLKYKDWLIRSLWLTIGVILLVLLAYYGTGWQTFGPRYAADFFPILYILLLHAFKNKPLKTKHKILIICSCLFNTYLIYATNFYRG